MAMISSVRAVDTDGTTKKIDISQNHETALRAKQNQEFNQDDIFEFKNLGIIGETEDGLLEIVTTTSQKPNIDIPKLAEILIAEENRDRKILWKRIITSNPEIKASDIQQVQKTYAKQIYEAAPKGHWFKRNDQWTQKF
ncbi:MAG: DUF1318 domain-containing protein [Pseudobacteriovorax sp.]|nr:DUF1318 domain-containing protein [Pseudobacteriovorax sp.]